MTEREMLELLHRRYGPWPSGLPRYINAEHVRSASGWNRRTADFVAVSSCQSDRYAIHGVEVKVNRSDWLRELNGHSADGRRSRYRASRHHADKAAEHLAWCNYWWLAIPHAGIAHAGEVPEGWGLLVARPFRAGFHLRQVVAAPYREVPPIPAESMASLLRAVAKTAAARATNGRAA